MPLQRVETLVEWTIQIVYPDGDPSDVARDCQMVLLSPEVVDENATAAHIISVRIPGGATRLALAAMLAGELADQNGPPKPAPGQTSIEDAIEQTMTAYGPEDAIAKQQRCARCGSRDIDEQCDLLITDISDVGELEDAATAHCARALRALEAPEDPTDPRGE